MTGHRQALHATAALPGLPHDDAAATTVAEPLEEARSG